ncbi:MULTISPECIES: carbohydrate ABC transporter permease [Paenibacillus]|uniref:ABC transporter permease n=1 Tax=Paenibacillus naphthalenovorans TaxID=162209 RepID=A0A0U2W486_9BACL|nr:MULTISPECIES: sugar ABC transporter permease [Paenibacillus]ALS23380.1 ABC transporter permease [Paenibacillus naphthalenovorans]GCL72861.1 sugar ABC transporter permease [Paenibacillus naphthalenovorans]SDI07083.1 ABC-type sugar transport system, permease component [Paenibacillus naphthalenovorans]
MKWNRGLETNTLRKIEGSLFIAPWVFGFLTFVAFPLGYSLYMSFHQVKITVNSVNYTFIGFQHYREILIANGSLLYEELLPFLRESAMMIPIILVFSLLVAILLNMRFPGRTLFRVIFFLPVIFSSGQIVQEFIAQGEGSLSIMETLRIDYYLQQYMPSAWVGPIQKVMNSFVLVLWYSGVQILIFLAGRQTLPPAVYEASRIDGSSPWNTFWKITLPGLVPYIFLNLMYTVVDLFTFPSNPIVSRVNTSNYGSSSALAWIYFSIILTFVLLTLWLYSRVDKSISGKR